MPDGNRLGDLNGINLWWFKLNNRLLPWVGVIVIAIVGYLLRTSSSADRERAVLDNRVTANERKLVIVDAMALDVREIRTILMRLEKLEKQP